jgi:hypothetical protein
MGGESGKRSEAAAGIATVLCRGGPSEHAARSLLLARRPTGGVMEQALSPRRSNAGGGAAA